MKYLAQKSVDEFGVGDVVPAERYDEGAIARMVKRGTLAPIEEPKPTPKKRGRKPRKKTTGK